MAHNTIINGNRIIIGILAFSISILGLALTSRLNKIIVRRPGLNSLLLGLIIYLQLFSGSYAIYDLLVYDIPHLVKLCF